MRVAHPYAQNIRVGRQRGAVQRCLRAMHPPKGLSIGEFQGRGAFGILDVMRGVEFKTGRLHCGHWSISQEKIEWFSSSFATGIVDLYVQRCYVDVIGSTLPLLRILRTSDLGEHALDLVQKRAVERICSTNVLGTR